MAEDASEDVWEAESEAEGPRCPNCGGGNLVLGGRYRLGDIFSPYGWVLLELPRTTYLSDYACKDCSKIFICDSRGTVVAIHDSSNPNAGALYL